MKKHKVALNTLLFYFIGGILILLTMLIVFASYTPLPIGIRASNQYTIEMNCNRIKVTITSLEGNQMTNNYMYAVNKATNERFYVQKTDHSDIELPKNLENPLIRPFIVGQVPPGTYDVFIKRQDNTTIASVSGILLSNCQ